MVQMEREREVPVAQALVEMASTFVSDFDVVELSTSLASSCVELTGISAAAVMVATEEGELRVLGSSSEETRVLELFELQAEEGPGLDAFRSAEPVDPVVLHAGGGPWPRFSAAALSQGYQSVSAFPLRFREMTIGALSLFSAGRAALSEHDAVVAGALADCAAIGIVAHRSVDEQQRTIDQLSNALRSRIVIEQAKGIIAERAGVDLPEAFDRLRGYARDHGLRLTDVAHAAVEGTLGPEAWASPRARRQRREP